MLSRTATASYVADPQGHADLGKRSGNVVCLAVPRSFKSSRDRSSAQAAFTTSISPSTRVKQLRSQFSNEVRDLGLTHHRAVSIHSRRATQQVQALFTGIVQGMAEVQKIKRKSGDFITMRIAFPPGAVDDVAIGASVAINGTCLTVTKCDVKKKKTVLSFDLIMETLRATNLGELKKGSQVNFERSARLGDEVGGHHVSGHVHGKATVSDVQQTEDNRRIEFTFPNALAKYILPKGFIAVDGCSLTVGEVEGNSFSVYLIPETLRVTVLGEKFEGAAVNLEIDAQTQAIVDTVERYLAQGSGGGPAPAADAEPAEPSPAEDSAAAWPEPVLGRMRYLSSKIA